MVDQQYVITGPLNPKYYSPNSTSFNNPTSGSGKVDISFGGNANQFLRIAGPENCGRRDSLVKARIQVFKSDDVLIFETLPVDTNPDIFLENDNVFDIVGGIHKGTTQDQSSTQPAICFPNFYNCYSFGNGAESYKIRDSIVGPTFDLGNRVFGVQSEDYEEVHRFADLHTAAFTTTSRMSTSLMSSTLVFLILRSLKSHMVSSLCLTAERLMS